MHSYMDVWVALKRFLAARIKVTRAKFVEVHGMMQLENRDQSNASYIFHSSLDYEVCWVAKSMYNPYDMNTKEHKKNGTQSICQVYILYKSLFNVLAVFLTNC